MQIDINELPQLIVRGALLAHERLNATDVRLDQWLAILADNGGSDNDAFVSLGIGAYFHMRALEEDLTTEERKALYVLAATVRGICESKERYN